MQTIRVITGFGFYRNAQGRIVGKAQLPAGDHDIADGYVYTEVANQEALDLIEIYYDVTVVQRRASEAKITAWIDAWLRTLAIQDLKNKGELPAGYE